MLGFNPRIPLAVHRVADVRFRSSSFPNLTSVMLRTARPNIRNVANCETCGRSKETLFLRRPIISQSDAAWRRPEIGSSPPLPLPVVRGQPSSLGNEVGLVLILTPSFSCTFGYTFPLFLSRCQTTMVLLSGCAWPLPKASLSIW